MTEQENTTDADEQNPGKPTVDEPTEPALNPDDDSFDESQDEPTS